MKKLNDSDHQSSTSPLMEGTPTIKSKKKLLQIIDTTLLKCYLHVSFLGCFSVSTHFVYCKFRENTLEICLSVPFLFADKCSACGTVATSGKQSLPY